MLYFFISGKFSFVNEIWRSFMRSIFRIKHGGTLFVKITSMAHIYVITKQVRIISWFTFLFKAAFRKYSLILAFVLKSTTFSQWKRHELGRSQAQVIFYFNCFHNFSYFDILTKVFLITYLYNFYYLFI